MTTNEVTAPNISRDQLTKLAYELSQAIEQLPASTEQTALVTKCSGLMRDLWNRTESPHIPITAAQTTNKEREQQLLKDYTSEFDQFCLMFGVTEKMITRIPTKDGEYKIVWFGSHRAIRNPDAKPGECPWVNPWVSIAMVSFAEDGAFQNYMMCPGYLQHIGVSEFNLLNDIAESCRQNGDHAHLVECLDNLRRRNLDSVKRGMDPLY